MGLNKVNLSSNMYQWLNANNNQGYTWNPIGGECMHRCSYCYVRRMPRLARLDKYKGPTRLFEKEFINLGRDKTIFVCSCTDLFGWWVNLMHIHRIMEHCNKYPENTYFFQTKNPARLKNWLFRLPPKVILGITLESNRDYHISKAPCPEERVAAFSEYSEDFKSMVSIEPIMDFDLPKFVDWIKYVNPSFVSIGADSKKSNLPEPSASKVKELISALEKFTKVYVKKNLRRLMEGKGKC